MKSYKLNAEYSAPAKISITAASWDALGNYPTDTYDKNK